MVQNSNSSYQNISIGFPWKILVFSAIVFGFTLFTYFGLQFGYMSFLDSRSKNLDQKINDLARVVSQEDQQQFISFYSQLVNLKEVLQKHTLLSPSLTLLERYTIPSVYYTSGRIIPKDQKIEVVGRANSIDSFVEQLYVFDGSSDFRQRALVSQMGFDQGKVAFTISLFPRQENFNLMTQ
jgi:hypothetical protein